MPETDIANPGSQLPEDQASPALEPGPENLPHDAPIDSGDIFEVHFWGVRGSIPSPGPETVRYGGNTSCVEMRVGGKRLIFDGGTGLRVLGKHLLSQMPIEAHIFFTHSHWDHIQGFPFFVPAFIPGNCFQIYGAIAASGETMKQRLTNQMLHPNFPVPIQIMKSDLKFVDLTVGDQVSLGDVTIETGLLNHPNSAMGYRVSWKGHSVVYATDTEHYPDRVDENLVHLARDADILIYDACYTDQEYNDPKSPKTGWGHSTWQAGLEVAKAAGVKRPVMFHHDPNHDDDFLDRVESEVQAAFPMAILAREGMILRVI
ncbi:MBL fold metallo-hydrolase [Leptolyngbya sp. 'hensonii']|uniref:MBL fold metallo-hydrolase n=1 Tax=Leptolyngbya sp. 'hensonii' TaxID=1922337 RepID=UPI00094FE56E|nr:MBL fold metallo-hydrolase [Leptolyngbya sp. 'hensonii']OLP19703.1 MBL fold metallo-hydrolase [Leptolyngbya sp. 'hensonii']